MSTATCRVCGHSDKDHLVKSSIILTACQRELCSCTLYEGEVGL